MKKKVAVIGLGRFGVALVRELIDRGVDVLAINDVDEDLDGLEEDVDVITPVDARDPAQLRDAGVDGVDEAVVAIGEDFEAAEEIVLALQEIGIEKITARAQTEERREILALVGAERVVSPEVESAARVADHLAHVSIIKAIAISSDIEAATLEVPRAFDGKTVAELAPNERFGVLIVKVEHRDAQGEVVTTAMPARADTRLEAGDAMIVVGSSKAINDFMQGETVVPDVTPTVEDSEPAADEEGNSRGSGPEAS